MLMDENKTSKNEVTESQVTTAVAAKVEEPENKYLVVFAKPFTFEGKTYDNVDLSGLEDLTAKDMIATNKIMERGGTINVLPEMSLEYSCIISSKAANLPIEFFQALPPKEALKVKNRVTSFFYSED